MKLSELREELEMSLTLPINSLFKRPEFGHRFGELVREEATEDTRKKAQVFAMEAVAWMVQIGHLDSVSATARYVGMGRLSVTTVGIAPTGDDIAFTRYVQVHDVQ